MFSFAPVIGWIGGNPKIASAIFIVLVAGLVAIGIDRHATHRTENKSIIAKVKTNNKVTNEKDRIRSMPRGLSVSIDELRHHRF